MLQPYLSDVDLFTTHISIAALTDKDKLKKKRISLRSEPGKERVGFGQKVPRNVRGKWMFGSVVWFCSQISKVKSTVFYSSKVERNSCAETECQNQIHIYQKNRGSFPFILCNWYAVLIAEVSSFCSQHIKDRSGESTKSEQKSLYR